jgi:hypothetical protein
MSGAVAKLLPRFDTGDWSLYELGGGYASRAYQKFVTDLLAKLARQTQDPFWVATSRTFHAYYYDPPQVTQTTATPAIWPQPRDGYLDVAPIQLNLSMRASVTVAVGGKVTTYRWSGGSHTLTWKPPAGLAPGTYPVQVTASSYAGNRKTFALPPVVVAWDTAPQAATSVSLVGTTLT